MATALYTFKFTVEVDLPHDIASFQEAQVFIPDVKYSKDGGHTLTPELILLEVEHDYGENTKWEVE